MFLRIQCAMLQKPHQFAGEIPVHFMETSSLVHCGINLNYEVTELWVSMLCDLLWESIWILFFGFFSNWIGSFFLWEKEAPRKSCHKSFLCSSPTRLKWRPITTKMLCLWEKFHLLNLSVSSMLWCARSLHSTLMGVRKRGCLQWLSLNFLISAMDLGVEERNRKVEVLEKEWQKEA